LGARYALEWEYPARQALAEKEMNFLNHQLVQTRGDTVLDVGIGTGRIVENYLHRTVAQNIYGVDLADEMVRVCHQRFAGERRVKELALCDVSRLDVPFNGSFDFISAVRTIKYIQNWRGTIELLLGRLSSEGILVFTMPNVYSLSRFSRQGEVLWHKTSQAEIENLCEQLGVRIVDMAGFTRLPARLYTASQWPPYCRMLLHFEKVLERILGRRLLVRELFVAVTR
jgi:predicted TPR repeat methyltransferase